jgi:hypothetical protein
MSADELLTYSQIREKIGSGRSHLLLGNGFSISCDKRFLYGRLFDFAKQNGLTERVLGVFERLGTNNFEGVMRLLEDADWLARHYGLVPGALETQSYMREDLQSVKNALVAALALTHLEHTGKVADERKSRCAKFLEPYHNIFTTNYDLLLYWVEMHALEVLQGRDGFDYDIEEPEADYVVFSEHVGGEKGIFFIHGALHLHVVNGQVRKHTWSRTQVPLIQSIRKALDEGQYPLFVAEGLPERKLEQIQRSGYLSYCLGKLERIEKSLVVYGLSFGQSDRHIANVIADNRELRSLYVGLYGDPNNELNLDVKKNVQAIRERRTAMIEAKRARHTLDVHFYDAASASVWDLIA